MDAFPFALHSLNSKRPTYVWNLNEHASDEKTEKYTGLEPTMRLYGRRNSGSHNKALGWDWSTCDFRVFWGLLQLIPLDALILGSQSVHCCFVDYCKISLHFQRFLCPLHTIYSVLKVSQWEIWKSLAVLQHYEHKLHWKGKRGSAQLLQDIG